MEIKDIEKLAKLSRIKLSDSEKESFRKEIDSILSYVAQIKEASSAADNSGEEESVRNVWREDENPNKAGENTEKILKEVPNKKGDYVKVKKIIQQDV